MKCRLKSEIAQACGMGRTTMTKWIKKHSVELSKLGVEPKQRLLTPKAVRYICDELGIHEEDFLV